MVDIHCHILPDVDDGSDSMETSLIMARLAVSSGVDTLVATPHCNVPNMHSKNYFSQAFKDSFMAFSRQIKAAGIPLTVLPGMEVYTTEELIGLMDERKIITLNGSRYLLMEFDFSESWQFMSVMLDKVREYGLCPVIAHPERYYEVQKNVRLIAGWYERGYVLQLNKSSILGHFGKREKSTADWMLENALAHVVASDAHSSSWRTPHMGEIQHELEYSVGDEYARILLEENPRRIIHNEELA